MKIDRYESELQAGETLYFAITGKKRIPMPAAYKDMYDNDHLAIQEIVIPANQMPELLGFEPGQEVRAWMPLLTNMSK